jgi:hypothetical protein
MAGSLPAPAQNVTHSTLANLGLEVPSSPRYNDPVACPGGPFANHGEYVKAHKGDPNAAQSPCGKPVGSGG